MDGTYIKVKSNLIPVFKLLIFHDEMFPNNLTHALTSNFSSSLLDKAVKSTLKFIPFHKQLLYLILKILQQSNETSV